MLSINIGCVIYVYASHEGASPTVPSILDRVSAQTIDLSELLNTLQGYGFAAFCCPVMGLSLDFGLWA